MDYEKMTDEEFWAMLERIYGAEWLPDDLKPDAALYAEYLKRVSTGTG